MKQVRLKIGGKAVDAPVFEDVHTTRELAKKVTERLAEIEKASNRIDTQAFALIAAMSFAQEAEAMAKAQEAETEEMLRRLDDLSKRLRVIEGQ
jgi:cell division protein ZapA (FtsZ GTPase activity inhibitor)